MRHTTPKIQLKKLPSQKELEISISNSDWVVSIGRKKKGFLDGIALLFIVIGIILIVSTQSQNVVNLGWVMFIIGIVKQMISQLTG